MSSGIYQGLKEINRKFKSHTSLFATGCKRKMPTECKYCKKSIDPIFKIDGGIDSRVCPECGHIIDAYTDNIQVIGRDM